VSRMRTLHREFVGIVTVFTSLQALEFKGRSRLLQNVWPKLGVEFGVRGGSVNVHSMVESHTLHVGRPRLNCF
jgi:hypothetical protein